MRALKTGYGVIVLTAHPEKISLRHDNLRIVRGDAEDESLVHGLIEGVDAVVCLFRRQTATAIKNIVSGAQRHDVRRCIFFSESVEADVSGAKRQSLDRLRHFLRPVAPEDVRGIDLIRQSDRDWTILHPFDQENAPTAHHRIDISGNTYDKVKDNFAHFILGQITDTTYLSKVLSI
jgi:nucleoside-diphosphate-sugar epimerase